MSGWMSPPGPDPRSWPPPNAQADHEKRSNTALTVALLAGGAVMVLLVASLGAVALSRTDHKDGGRRAVAPATQVPTAPAASPTAEGTPLPHHRLDIKNDDLSAGLGYKYAPNRLEDAETLKRGLNVDGVIATSTVAAAYLDALSGDTYIFIGAVGSVADPDQAMLSMARMFHKDGYRGIYVNELRYSGKAGCLMANYQGKEIPVCMWADNDTVAMLTGTVPTDTKLEKVFTMMRGDIEQDA